MTMQVYESSNLRGTAPGLRDYAEVPLGLRTQCRRFPAEPRQCVGLPPGDARGPGPLLIAAVLDDRLGIEVSARTGAVPADALPFGVRSEEHTSELQSRGHLVCRLLLEKHIRVT